MFVCECLIGAHFGFGNVWHYPLIVAIDSKEDEENEENVPPPPKLDSRQKKILWGHLKARWVQGSFLLIYFHPYLWPGRFIFLHNDGDDKDDNME